MQTVSLELDSPVDLTVSLRERETELVRIVEALERVGLSRDWQLLEDLIFKGVLTALNRELATEIKKQPLNGPKIHSLNGQIKWAEKFINLASLASIYKQELSSIRKAYAKNGSRRTSGGSGSGSSSNSTETD